MTRLDNELRVSFRRLRAFDAVARLQSLSAAAHSLRLSQPALTQSITHLEQQLGVKLFDRQAEGSFLTAMGAVFHHRTTRFFEHLAHAISTLRHTSAQAAEVKAIVNKLSSAHLRALIAIWQQGHFKAAALSLGVALPSLQRPARNVELLIGVPLYRRTAAGLCVNENGDFLGRRFAVAMGEFDAGADEMSLSQHQSARIRIGILPLAPRMMLAQAMQHVVPAHHHGKIEVVDGAYEEIARRLNDGALDLMIGALRAPKHFPDLIEEPFFEDPYVIVSGPHHPLLTTKTAHARQLRDYEWILPTQGLPRRQVLDDWLTSKSIQPQNTIETACLHTIAALLATSQRLSILSHWYAQWDGAGLVREVRALKIHHPARFIGLSYRRSWLPTTFQAAILDQLRSSAKKIKTSSSLFIP
jgi:DNA-binding transcriptional LysR family regulator